MNDDRKISEMVWAGELFPPYDFDDEELTWFCLHRLPLPPGWNKASSELLILIPDAYPEVPPEKFYLDPDLRDRKGRPPEHYFLGELSIRDWAWFCLHFDDGWAPRRNMEEGDNLITVIERIQIGLAGEVKR